MNLNATNKPWIELVLRIDFSFIMGDFGFNF